MTNSETSIDSQPTAPAATSAPRGRFWLIGTGLSLLGLLYILAVHNWRLGIGGFFLFASWVSLLLVGHHLWRAAWQATDDTLDDCDYWKPVGALEELQQEKRALLKAIKEIDFDTRMNKLAEADAALLTRMYRARAIEVIKAIDAYATVNTQSDAASPIASQDAEFERDLARELELRVSMRARKRTRQAAADRRVAASSASGPVASSKVTGRAESSEPQDPQPETDKDKS